MQSSLLRVSGNPICPAETRRAGDVPVRVNPVVSSERAQFGHNHINKREAPHIFGL